MPGVQANSIAAGMESAFGIAPTVTAALLAILLSFIIFGGVKRIATFAGLVVPFMAQAYVIVALVIVGLHIEELPRVMHLIISSAFGFDAGFGAMLGIAIQWGVKRGVYSNEAGQGTGPHASSAASVSHPAKQGLVQAFSVYVDTLFVCSATAFMLLITGRYNVQAPDGSAVYTGITGVAAGPGYTQVAMESIMPGFGSSFVALALFFFAFTTIVAYYYIAETNIAYINRRVNRPWLMFALKVALTASTAYGAVKTADLAWGLGDLGVGLMAWLNITAIILLQKPAFLALRDYEEQRARGLDPVFHPEKLGIPNAEYWAGQRAEDNLRLEAETDEASAPLAPERNR